MHNIEQLYILNQRVKPADMDWQRGVNRRSACTTLRDNDQKRCRLPKTEAGKLAWLPQTMVIRIESGHLLDHETLPKLELALSGGTCRSEASRGSLTAIFIPVRYRWVANPSGVHSQDHSEGE